MGLQGACEGPGEIPGLGEDAVPKLPAQRPALGRALGGVPLAICTPAVGPGCRDLICKDGFGRWRTEWEGEPGAHVVPPEIRV